MTTPSSKAVIKKDSPSFGRILLIIFGLSSLLIALWFTSNPTTDPFLLDALNKNGSLAKGNKLFKMNCVGCHGISAQGLVGPDLHKVSTRMSDRKIINQVIKGQTPPMPSFDIDSQSMADLLAYMHSLQ